MQEPAATHAPQLSQIVESLECHISLQRDLTIARHEYKYHFLGLISNDAASYYYFDVPNAKPTQITELSVYEESYLGSVVRDFPGTDLAVSPRYPDGTRITFEYRRPLPGDHRKLLFYSYDAPSSVYIHNGVLETIGFHQAQFEHNMPVNKLDLKISLPNRFTILAAEPDGRKHCSSVHFSRNTLSSGETYYFATFFRRRHLGRFLLGPLVAYLVAAVSHGAVLALLGKTGDFLGRIMPFGR